MYDLIKLSELENIQTFYDFCRDASLETSQPAACNMWHPEWHSQPQTLPYVLTKNNRFSEPKGEFYLALHAGQIVGCSGVYISDFCDTLALAGTRTWIHRDHRHKHISRDVFLPAEKAWAKNKGMSAVALTFNEHNKNIIEIWKRVRLGERRSPRQPHHMFYSNFNEVPFPVQIQYTEQWVIYEVLKDFEFDWHAIQVFQTSSNPSS